MSILLATHSLIKDTHLHMQHTQRGVLILHAVIALRQPNGSLRHRKGTLASFPPKKALVWEGFCGDLDSDFLGNLLWAIFSDQDKSAESCLFSFWSRGRWRLMCVFESYGRTTTAGNWPHIPNPQLKLHPSLSLFLSPPFIPPCCLPSTPLCSLFAASLACQMVFEWILKSRLHWTSIIFLRFFFLVVLKKALLNDSLEAHLQKQNYS